MEKEALVEVKQKMTAIIIKKFTPDGVRIQSNAVGKVEGTYSGRHLETIDILQKPDGSNQWQSRIIQTTTDGDVVLIEAKGTGRQDTVTTLQFKGEGTIRTQSKKLSALDYTECWIEGTNNLENNEATFTIYKMNKRKPPKTK